MIQKGWSNRRKVDLTIEERLIALRPALRSGKDPSPAEIKALTEEIQKNWTPDERLRRAGRARVYLSSVSLVTGC